MLPEELTIDFVTDLKQELRRSVRDLSHWKLYNSSKWSAEALNGMISTKDLAVDASTDMSSNNTPLKFKLSSLVDPQAQDNNSNVTLSQESKKLDPMMGFNEDDYDLYLFASSLFDCKEFDRCAHYLRNVTEPRLKFLKLYAQFLVWDKKYMESTESVLMTGKLDKATSRTVHEHKVEESGYKSSESNSMNPFINSNRIKDSKNKVLSESGHNVSLSLLLEEITSYFRIYFPREGSSQVESAESNLGTALLYYLKGVMLTRQSNKTSAMTAFLKSLSYYIFNWGCWSELLGCISRIDEAYLLLNHIEHNFTIKDPHGGVQRQTNSNVMVDFFKLSIYQEFYSASMDSAVMDTVNPLNSNNGTGNASQLNTPQGNNLETADPPNSIDGFFRILEYLIVIMPNFAFLKSMNAMISYNYMDYINAEGIFDDIVTYDPYRLENLDIYSNILYVMQKHSKLTYLAQFVSQLDKFRPETNCIVANYYSARQEHEKSIMYFRRALVLNKKSTSAWTLMGHEFVELKNSHAAIECYRRAVDINERDFKAWYGLGQAYEVLDMHLYSLYYFQKACTLKPLDSRMWQAVAECYAELKDITQAIKCFNRAYQLSSNPVQNTKILYNMAKQYELMLDIDNCKKNMLRCVGIDNKSYGEVSTHESNKAKLWLARYEMRMSNFKAAYNYALDFETGTSEELAEARKITSVCKDKF